MPNDYEPLFELLDISLTVAALVGFGLIQNKRIDALIAILLENMDWQRRIIEKQLEARLEWMMQTYRPTAPNIRQIPD